MIKQNVTSTFSAHGHFQCAYLSQLGDSFINRQDGRPTSLVITARTRFKYALVRAPRASARSGLPIATVSRPNKRHYKRNEDNENGRFDEFSLFTKSVHVKARYRDWIWANGQGSIPGNGDDPLHHCVQTICGVYPPFCPMDNRSLFSGDKVGGEWRRPLITI